MELEVVRTGSAPRTLLVSSDMLFDTRMPWWAWSTPADARSTAARVPFTVLLKEAHLQNLCSLPPEVLTAWKSDGLWVHLSELGPVSYPVSGPSHFLFDVHGTLHGSPASAFCNVPVHDDLPPHFVSTERLMWPLSDKPLGMAGPMLRLAPLVVPDTPFDCSTQVAQLESVDVGNVSALALVLFYFARLGSLLMTHYQRNCSFSDVDASPTTFALRSSSSQLPRYVRLIARQRIEVLAAWEGGVDNIPTLSSIFHPIVTALRESPLDAELSHDLDITVRVKEHLAVRKAHRE